MRKFINYCKESFTELTKKTTWPTWSKLQSSALLVIVTTVLLVAVAVHGLGWLYLYRQTQR